MGNGGCEQKCVNQVPGYECQCDSGYSLDSDNMSCVANAECSGEGDDFACQCLDGFRDETNGSGSGSGIFFSCIGKSEYLLNSYSYHTLSTDVDECFEGVHTECSMYADCVNTPGSYRCVCSNGYTGNGTYCCKLKNEPFIRHCMGV